MKTMPVIHLRIRHNFIVNALVDRGDYHAIARFLRAGTKDLLALSFTANNGESIDLKRRVAARYALGTASPTFGVKNIHEQQIGKN